MIPFHMNFDIQQVKMLTAIAQYIEHNHPTKPASEQLLKNISLLDQYVKELRIDWSSIAKSIDMTRDKLYHWYIETHLRQMCGDQITKDDRKKILQEIESGIASRAIEDEDFKQRTFEKVFANREVLRSHFNMTYNNQLRNKKVIEVIKSKNIILPNRKDSSSVQADADIESFSQSQSERTSISQQQLSSTSVSQQKISILNGFQMLQPAKVNQNPESQMTTLQTYPIRTEDKSNFMQHSSTAGNTFQTLRQIQPNEANSDLHMQSNNCLLQDIRDIFNSSQKLVESNESIKTVQHVKTQSNNISQAQSPVNLLSAMNSVQHLMNSSSSIQNNSSANRDISEVNKSQFTSKQKLIQMQKINEEQDQDVSFECE